MSVYSPAAFQVTLTAVKPSVQSLGDHLVRTARARPGHAAVEWPGGSLTYAKLLARAEAGAAALAARGAQPGDRVALLLPAGADFAVAFWACQLSGLVAMPVDLRLVDAERAAQTESAAVVVDERLDEGGGGGSARGERPALPRIQETAGRSAVVIHTSGTAGASKPVELTHANFVWSALASAVALGLEPDERWLCPLPLSHVGGVSILVRSAIYGTTAVVQDGWDAERVAAALRDDGITLASLVPTMVARLLAARHGAPSPGLRCALIGGGPLPVPVAARAH